MKTKHYLILAGLLMATCITNYGQEIVNEFMFQKTDRNFYECNLFENNDGTLLFRTMMCTPYTYENWQHLLYKTTPEGEVIDSLTIDAVGDWSYMFRNPLATDSYILTDDIKTYNETDSIVSAVFRMFFIDENLNLNDEIIVPVIQFPFGFYEFFSFDIWFIDTQNDFILSFWTDNIFHLIRIGLDGTIKTSHETTEIYAYNYNALPPQPNGDTTLLYSELGFGMLNESPLTYYKLGSYKPSSGAYPIFGFVFDADFNLIETRLFDQYDEGFAFDGGNSEHILPFDENSYLTATQITSISQKTSGIGLAKYDINHNQICVSPLFGTNNSFPYQTEIVNGSTIYQLYDRESQRKLALARLDGELNLNWDFILPINQMMWGYCMTVLKNGDIIAGGICRKSNRYCASFVTLHDDYDSTPEMTSVERPFTLYPNPVKDQLNLTFTEGTKPESLNLFDLQGRIVGTKCNGLESIDMSALSAGVYMLRITMKDGASYYEKVIKE